MHTTRLLDAVRCTTPRSPLRSLVGVPATVDIVVNRSTCEEHPAEPTGGHIAAGQKLLPSLRASPGSVSSSYHSPSGSSPLTTSVREPLPSQSQGDEVDDGLLLATHIESWLLYQTTEANYGSYVTPCPLPKSPSIQPVDSPCEVSPAASLSMSMLSRSTSACSLSLQEEPGDFKRADVCLLEDACAQGPSFRASTAISLQPPFKDQGSETTSRSNHSPVVIVLSSPSSSCCSSPRTPSSMDSSDRLAVSLGDLGRLSSGGGNKWRALAGEFGGSADRLQGTTHRSASQISSCNQHGPVTLQELGLDSIFSKMHDEREHSDAQTGSRPDRPRHLERGFIQSTIQAASCVTGGAATGCMEAIEVDLVGGACMVPPFAGLGRGPRCSTSTVTRNVFQQPCNKEVNGKVEQSPTMWMCDDVREDSDVQGPSPEQQLPEHPWAFTTASKSTKDRLQSPVENVKVLESGSNRMAMTPNESGPSAHLIAADAFKDGKSFLNSNGNGRSELGSTWCPSESAEVVTGRLPSVCGNSPEEVTPLHEAIMRGCTPDADDDEEQRPLTFTVRRTARRKGTRVLLSDTENSPPDANPRTVGLKKQSREGSVPGGSGAQRGQGQKGSRAEEDLPGPCAKGKSQGDDLVLSTRADRRRQCCDDWLPSGKLCTPLPPSGAGGKGRRRGKVSPPLSSREPLHVLEKSRGASPDVSTRIEPISKDEVHDVIIIDSNDEWLASPIWVTPAGGRRRQRDLPGAATTGGRAHRAVSRTAQLEESGSGLVGRAFAKRRVALAERLYAEWNTLVFKGRLPVGLPLVWNPRLSCTAGQVIFNREKQIAERIELSDKVLDDEEKLRQTLAHEMCHVGAWHINKDFAQQHGHTFYSWGERFSEHVPDIEVTRCHTYEIFMPHRWQCTRCHKLYKRARNTIDTARHSCRCGGKLSYLGKFNKQGNPVNQQQPPSQYQQFIKDEFASVKKMLPPHTPHSEIMRVLSRRWKSTKDQAGNTGPIVALEEVFDKLNMR